MEIIKNITTRNRTKSNVKQNKYIVIHYVGAVSSAKANSIYFKSTYRGASAHYFVDENSIYQVVEEKDIAWHVGASYYKHLNCRNSNSIGIEMCCYRDKNGRLEVSDRVVEKTIELTKELMRKYNIPVEHVLRHYDVTGKNCPEPFVRQPSRWTNFLNKLKSQTIDKKYKLGDAVEIHVPVLMTGAEQGDNVLVDSNGYQFWIHKSVIRNGNIIARAVICYVAGDGLYMMQVFDKQFWCKEYYIYKKL